MRAVRTQLQKPVGSTWCLDVCFGPRSIFFNKKERWIGREGSERATACRDLCGVCATAHLSSLSFFFFSFCFSGHRLAGSGHARIHFLDEMCDGISAWNLANEFTRSRNLSQIFPENTRHCPGDAGFNVSQGGMHIHTHMEIYFRM